MSRRAAYRAHPASLAGVLAERRQLAADQGLVERLRSADAALWPAPAISRSRLGWLTLADSMPPILDEIAKLADAVAAEGVRDVLVLGMGGSSLAAEVFAGLLGSAAGRPRVSVLDTTHPAAVSAYVEAFPPATSLYLVASKSGTTLESLALFEIFWENARSHGGGRRFVAITDPGTRLVELARARGFRQTFLAPADVGGRFSALTHFGLVPAVLAGADARGLLADAGSMAREMEEAVDLGLLLGEGVRGGRDKVTLLTSPSLQPFVSWLEQLLAESTGKDGTGVVPVSGEPQSAHLGGDRLFVRLQLAGEPAAGPAAAELVAAGHPVVELEWPDPGIVGGEMMRWEIATAIAAAVLEVQPFDQPDVDLAKELARRAMTGAVEEAGDPALVDASDGEALQRALAGWLEGAAPGDYIALQAFLPPAPEVQTTIAKLRADLAATGLPTTLGFGPRFLHSTGQLHKGGPAGVYCLQLVDRGGADLVIPDTELSCRRLIDGQALGDARALAARGRAVLRVRLGE